MSRTSSASCRWSTVGRPSCGRGKLGWGTTAPRLLIRARTYSGVHSVVALQGSGSLALVTSVDDSRERLAVASPKKCRAAGWSRSLRSRAPASTELLGDQRGLLRSVVAALRRSSMHAIGASLTRRGRAVTLSHVILAPCVVQEYAHHCQKPSARTAHASCIPRRSSVGTKHCAVSA